MHLKLSKAPVLMKQLKTETVHQRFIERSMLLDYIVFKIQIQDQDLIITQFWNRRSFFVK